MTLIKSFSLSLNSRSTSSRPRATICLKRNRTLSLLTACQYLQSAQYTQRKTPHGQSCQVEYTYVRGNNRRPLTLQSQGGKAWRQELNACGDRAVLHVGKGMVFMLLHEHLKGFSLINLNKNKSKLH